MTTETDKPADAPEVPAPEVPTPEVVDGADKPDPVAVELAAFDKGVAEAKAEEPPDAPENPEAPAPEPAKPEGEAKPDKPEPEKDDAAKRDEAVEAEIATLGLKEKTAERFRELSKRPSEAEIAPLRERAERADEWERQIAATGASPEQFGATVSYTALAVRANAGDIEAAKEAYKATKGEMEHWAKMLGMEAPGVDPLAAHADLSRDVEAGDLTRARALEIAQARAASAVQASASQQRQTQAQQEAAHNAAVDAAMVEIGTLNATLKASDPAFAHKLPLLQPTLKLISESLPPQRWAGAIRQAYADLPAMAAPAAPAAPPVSSMPVRPTGAAAAQVRKPKNDMEAFEMGAASAR